MKKRIIGIVLLAAALGTVFLGIKAGGAAPANKKILQKAVYVAGGENLPENEGKTVVVTATLAAPLPFVDEKTGVSLNSIVAYRHVDKLEIQPGSDEEPDIWRWDFTAGEEHYGGSKKLIAPQTTFGEFTVSEELLQAVNAHTKLADYSHVDLSSLGLDYFKEDGIVYLYAGPIMHHDGDTVGKITKTDYNYKDQRGTARVSYDVLPEDADLRYTIVATQKNGRLEDIAELKMTDVIAGHLTEAELLEYADSSASTAKITAFIIAAVLAALGVLLLIKGGMPVGSFKKEQG